MGSFDVWVQDALTKVFRDSIKPEDAGSEVTIDTVRNEYEAVQIVVEPFEDVVCLKQVSPILDMNLMST